MLRVMYGAAHAGRFKSASVLMQARKQTAHASSSFESYMAQDMIHDITMKLYQHISCTLCMHIYIYIYIYILYIHSYILILSKYHIAENIVYDTLHTSIS